MKTFIDNKGTFELKVPSTWKYSLKEDKVHTFQEYEIWKPDAFQVSIQKPDGNIEEKFKFITQNLESSIIDGKKYYNFPESKGDNFITKTWTILIKDEIVLFSLTYSINPDKELETKTIKQKLEEVTEIIASFGLIKPEESESKINLYRFIMFLQGIGATSYMLNKAIKNNAFIEATCITANQIDGLLRIGVVLQKQIDNSNSKIENEWIYQGLKDKKKSEKDIYKKAKELGVITEEIFKELFRLYDDRNRVMHRFIISEITLAEVEDISYNYYKMLQKINSIIYDLESEQIKLNVGMTANGKEDNEDYINSIKGKIGKQNYFENKE